jgi:hypothetical protein
MDEIYFSVSFAGRFCFRTDVMLGDRDADIAREALARLVARGYKVTENRRPASWSSTEVIDGFKG